MQVPDETVHAGAGYKRLMRPDPVCGDVQVGIRCRWPVGALEACYHLAVGIQNVERHRTVGGVFQIVIKNRPVGRILSGRFFGRQRRIGVRVARIAVCNSRRE